MTPAETIPDASRRTEAEDFNLPDLIGKVERLRDEVTGAAYRQFGGRSREIHMALAKLDECRLWLVACGEAFGTHEVIDIAKLRADAAAIHRNNTVATVTNRWE